jgi:hypothetical protein
VEAIRGGATGRVRGRVGNQRCGDVEAAPYEEACAVLSQFQFTDVAALEGLGERLDATY